MNLILKILITELGIWVFSFFSLILIDLKFGDLKKIEDFFGDYFLLEVFALSPLLLFLWFLGLSLGKEDSSDG